MSLKNPTDALVAQKLGEYELNRIRMAWALDATNKELARVSAVLDAKEAEIVALKAAAAADKFIHKDVGEGAEENGAGLNGVETKH